MAIGVKGDITACPTPMHAWDLSCLGFENYWRCTGTSNEKLGSTTEAPPCYVTTSSHPLIRCQVAGLKNKLCPGVAVATYFVQGLDIGTCFITSLSRQRSDFITRTSTINKPIKLRGASGGWGICSTTLEGGSRAGNSRVACLRVCHCGLHKLMNRDDSSPSDQLLPGYYYIVTCSTSSVELPHKGNSSSLGATLLRPHHRNNLRHVAAISWQPRPIATSAANSLAIRRRLVPWVAHKPIVPAHTAVPFLFVPSYCLELFCPCFLPPLFLATQHSHPRRHPEYVIPLFPMPAPISVLWYPSVLFYPSSSMS